MSAMSCATGAGVRKVRLLRQAALTLTVFPRMDRLYQPTKAVVEPLLETDREVCADGKDGERRPRMTE